MTSHRQRLVLAALTAVAQLCQRDAALCSVGAIDTDPVKSTSSTATSSTLCPPGQDLFPASVWPPVPAAMPVT